MLLLWSETNGRRWTAISVQLDRKPSAVATVLDALQSVRYDDRHPIVENCRRQVWIIIIFIHFSVSFLVYRLYGKMAGRLGSGGTSGSAGRAAGRWGCCRPSWPVKRPADRPRNPFGSTDDCHNGIRPKGIRRKTGTGRPGRDKPNWKIRWRIPQSGGDCIRWTGSIL